MMKAKKIKLEEDVYDLLVERKMEGESFDEAIRRLCVCYKAEPASKTLKLAYEMLVSKENQI